MIRAALVLGALALPAAATAQQDWPAMFYVTGVAAGDVLNVRAAPEASAAVVGQIAPKTRGIEGIAPNEDGTWALVNTGEGTGWVSLRFLARYPGQADGEFPRFARCFGTEPFWALTQTGPESYRFSTPEATGPQIAFEWTAATLGNRQRFAFLIGPFVGTLARERCSDGMSDRVYGLEVTLADPAQRQSYWGCCSLAMDR